MANKRKVVNPLLVRSNPLNDLDVATTMGNDGTDEDVLVMKSRFGAVMLPRSVANASPAVLECITAIQRITGHRAELLTELDWWVKEARSEGASWNTIGWSVGIAANNARKRWGLTDEPA